MSYAYWNDFVDTWRRLPISVFNQPIPVSPYNVIAGWKNPNLIPLLGTKITGDMSLQYIPEPWWGNNGIHPLHSVVVNYNPGGGGEVQHHNQSSNLFGFPDYGSYVNDEVLRSDKRLRRTHTFHKGKRASRVFNTLEAIGINLNGNYSLENHLSIELIPWHTVNIDKLRTYFSANLQTIYNHSLLFAAQEAKKIINVKLHNKVIVRISGTVIINLLNEMVHNGFGHHAITAPLTYTYKGCQPALIGGNGGYMKFKLDIEPSIDFICIWGTGKTGNDFPTKADMKWIFNNVI